MNVTNFFFHKAHPLELRPADPLQFLLWNSEQLLQCPESDCALCSGIERCPHFKDIVNHYNTDSRIVDLDTDQKNKEAGIENSENY